MRATCERAGRRERERADMKKRLGYLSCGSAIIHLVALSLSRSLTHSLAFISGLLCLPGHSLIRSLSACDGGVCASACASNWACESARSLSLSLSRSLADFNGRSEVFIVGTQYSQVAFLMPSAAKPAPFFTQTQHTHTRTHRNSLSHWEQTDSVAFLCSLSVSAFDCFPVAVVVVVVVVVAVAVVHVALFLLAFLGSSWKTAPQLATRLCVFSCPLLISLYSPSHSRSSHKTWQKELF